MADFTSSNSHLPQFFNEDVVLEDTDEKNQNAAKTKRPRASTYFNEI